MSQVVTKFISEDAVTNAKLAEMTTLTIKGNSTGGTTNPSDLSVTTVTAMLTPFVGDSGSGGTKGLVPAPSSGDAAANKVLGASGSWVTQAAASGVPTGIISAWTGGYFTNGSNAGYTSVLGANSVAGANAYLNPLGYYVCDGAALNDGSSPIWNAAGRYLPNLTDSRFLMGSTTAGSIGGATSTTLATTNLPSHTHGVGTLANASDAGHYHTSASSAIFLGGTTAIGAGSTATVRQSFEAGDPTNRTSTNGAHNHTISGSTASAGSGTAFENRPLFLSVLYVIKVKS